jgi:ABC-type Fe3+-citrate transport system substrate-binding protein
MLLEVSIGEALDKLSILHIKLVKIRNAHKLTEVNKEISSMNDIMDYMEKYKLFYKLLLHTNTKIWDLQDIISDTKDKISTEINIVYNEIFDLNQQRFRIKNIINMSEAGIQEQKGYNQKSIFISFNQDMLNEALPSILFVMLNYDIIYTQHNIPIQSPSICYDIPPGNIDVLNINDIIIPEDDFNFFSSLRIIPN